MSFQVACKQDLSPGNARMVTLQNSEGKELDIAIICDTEGDWYAIDDLCTHGEVSLSEGDIGKACVECWAHGAQFNLKTGEETLPAVSPVKTYPLKLEDQSVLVDLDS
ncbi:MAG: Rieske 2Fe-2S domain-containing protein [Actinomycetaceae bacterium]|nr:Rieske 2Fe-2S domain-containing protein [Actinomycetaceae bacterium]